MFILILISCALFSGVSCQDRPTIISPEGTELIKNAGEPIQFSCTGSKKIFFYYPTNYGSDKEVSKKVISSKIEESKTNTEFGSTYNLSRRKSVPGDTGWYGCSYHNRTITRKDYDDPKFSWVYIYVDSPNSSFVENVVETIKGVTGNTALIPCRPTLPNLQVIFYNRLGMVIAVEDNISYDPKFGFKMDHLSLHNNGLYKCSITRDDITYNVTYHLDVFTKPKLIIINEESYYSHGEIVDFHCLMKAYPGPEIYWTFLQCPNYPSQINTSLIELNHTTQMLSSMSYLSKASMKIEMSGIINCTACNSEGCNSTTSNVMMSDGVKEFGIIEPKGPIVESDDIKIICAASIYNYTNNILWVDNNNKVISENERIKIIYKTTLNTHRAILQIKNVQLNDSMIYKCIEETKDAKTISYRYYNLVVYKQKKPSFTNMNLNDTDLVIDFGRVNLKPIILKCYVYGMPIPQVTWYKDNVRLKNSEQYECKRDNQELYIKFVFEYDSGKYSCRAENRLGKIEAYQNILIIGKELPKGFITLIVVLIILLIGLTLYFTIKVRREKKMRKESTDLENFNRGDVKLLNRKLTVNDQAELLPYDKKWEFPRERLKLGEKLGIGQFGVVIKAEAIGIYAGENVTTVAVKMVRRTANLTYVRALASELKIMVHLGKHLNVVNLLGACTKNILKRELLVIVEYCRFGNLRNFLLRHRIDFINQIDPSTGKFDTTIGTYLLRKTASINSNNRFNYRGDYKDHNLKPICSQDLLSWAFQVARGMEYLSQRNVLHGDLAARNILLAENNVVKICDFGLSKTMYKDGNYKKKGNEPLPIKWMAIESIRYKVFSTQSDIWSFGIVLWEFFTLAETPYPGLEAEILYKKLKEGYRLEQPAYATPDVYKIMLQCWNEKPTLRPGFTELVESIGNLLEESVKTYYITLNTPYMEMNTMILDNRNDYLKMMSAPDHTTLSLAAGDYVNSPISENPPDPTYLCRSRTNTGDKSDIFNLRLDAEKLHSEFASMMSDNEDAIELSPIASNIIELHGMNNVDDPYLIPIEFAPGCMPVLKEQYANVKPIKQSKGIESRYRKVPRNHKVLVTQKSLIKNMKIDRSDNKDEYKEELIPMLNNVDDKPRNLNLLDMIKKLTTKNEVKKNKKEK